MTTTELINELRNRQHDRPIDRGITRKAADEIERLREALEMIADNGGMHSGGMTYNGLWCAKRAREALEETK